MLPIGTRTIREVEDQADPVNRLRDASSLLEYLLVKVTPNLADDRGSSKVDLGARVRHHEKLFSNPADVSWAVGIRNDVTHHSSARPKPGTAELERASGHLLNAIRELLPVLPRDAYMDVTGTPALGVGTPLPQQSPSTSVPAPSNTGRRPMPLAKLAIFAAIVALVFFALDKLPGLVNESPEAAQARFARQEVRALDAAHKEAADAIRATISGLLNRARSAQTMAEALQSEIARYDKEAAPLMHNEDGKRLAADRKGVETLTVLLDKPRLSKDEAERLLLRIKEEFVEPLGRALKQNPPAPPVASWGPQLDEVLAEATSGRDSYQELRTAFTALLAQAAQTKATGEQSLSGAIETVRQRQLLEQQDAIQASAAAERSAAIQRLAAAARDRAKAEGDAEEQKTLADAAAKQREATRLKANAEAERMMAKARDPEVVKKYSQFLAVGKYALSEGTNTQGATYRIESRLSYKAMLDHRFHTDAMRFAAFGSKLNWLPSHNEANTKNYSDNYDYMRNDRVGRWEYPTTRVGLEEIQRLQKEFFELAPYWVKIGALGP